MHSQRVRSGNPGTIRFLILLGAVTGLLLVSGCRVAAVHRSSMAGAPADPAARPADAAIPAPSEEDSESYQQTSAAAAAALDAEMEAFRAYMDNVADGDLRMDWLNKHNATLQAQTEAEEARLKWVHDQETPSHLVCPLCKGTGMMICVTCAGMGSGLSFPGQPAPVCLACKGLGKVKCSECQGTGFVNPDNTPDRRTHSGAHHFERCWHCINGKIPIMAYNKMEDLDCPYCNGSGRIWE